MGTLTDDEIRKLLRTSLGDDITSTVLRIDCRIALDSSDTCAGRILRQSAKERIVAALGRTDNERVN